MSLDLYLVAKWKSGYVDPYGFNMDGEEDVYFELDSLLNCTHNLTPMWEKAGIYDSLYNSDNCVAKDIVYSLEAGLKAMEDSPEEYKKLNPSNGWGSYEGAIRFLKNVLHECKKRPLAIIRVSK